MARILDFADGFTSATEPTTGRTSADAIKEFSDDASYVSNKGSAAADGDIYLNDTTDLVRVFVDGAWLNLADESTAQTLTNKSIDSDNNTITNIADADIKAAAGITRTKLASGTADHVLINDGSGDVSSEASLDETRGGTGQTTYSTGDVLYASAADTLSKLAAGTNGHVLTLAAGIPAWQAAGGGAASIEACVLKDLKTSGTVGGVGTPINTWNTATVNTLQNPLSVSWVSLSSNQFDLDAGDYLVYAFKTFRQTNRCRIKIRNTSDSTDDILGNSEYPESGDNTNNVISLIGFLQPASTKTYELQYRIQTSSGTRDQGIESSTGVSECYAQIAIIKVG